MEQNIILKDICKKYDEFQLDKINLSVPKGAIMGIIGENGAGKTTILKLILNLISRDGGSISILGMDNQKEEIKIKEQLGIVLDECVFHDGLKAMDVSQMMKWFYKTWDEKQFLSYLDRFQLPKNKIIKEYSKGMKVKLSLASALSHHAKILILDEPTSGLDPIVRNEILDLFLEFMMEEENSILISSHITTDLEKICDYITFLDKGKVLLSENKDEILNDYCILKCGVSDFDSIASKDILRYQKYSYGCNILMQGKQDKIQKYKDFVIDPIHLEEMMMYLIKGERI